MDVTEKHQLVASCTSPAKDLACNPGMCPDWEENQQPFGLWNNAQPTESHQSGLYTYVLSSIIHNFQKVETIQMSLTDKWINKSSIYIK